MMFELAEQQLKSLTSPPFALEGRMYAPNHIHVSLRQPVTLNWVCRSADEVYDLLSKLKLKVMIKEKSPA